MTKPSGIKLELTATDKILEISGWIFLVGLWGIVVISYPELPETIPLHFNFKGIPDSYGDKTEIFIIPVIATLLFIGLTFLTKNSQFLNFPNKITKQNAPQNYLYATRMIRILKNTIPLVFGIIIIRTFQVSAGEADSLGHWFVPVTTSLFVIPVFYFLFKIAWNKSGQQ